MNFAQLIKSRTFWTLVVMFLTNGVASMVGHVPEAYTLTANFILSALAMYFKLNPSQTYEK